MKLFNKILIPLTLVGLIILIWSIYNSEIGPISSYLQTEEELIETNTLESRFISKPTSNLYKSIELITFQESESLSSGDARNLTSIVSSDFIIHYNKINNKVGFFNQKGKLKSEFEVLDIVKGDPSVQIFYDNHLKVLFFASPNSGLIIGYSLNGELIIREEVDIHFSHFISLGQEKKFVFFSPMNVYKDSKCIIVTDNDFNVQAQFYELPDILRYCNNLSPRNLKLYNGKLYLNPVLSDIIYEVSLDGEFREVFSLNDLGLEQSVFSKQIPSSNLCENGYAKNPYQYMPINDFSITEDYLVINHNLNERYYHTVYNFETNQSVTHQSAVFVEGYGDYFQFAFEYPEFSDSEYLYRFREKQSYEEIIGHVQRENSSALFDSRIPLKLSSNLALFKFGYDFDEIFNSAHSFPSDIQENHSNDFATVTLYPNPTQGSLNVRFRCPNDDSRLSARIFNYNGQMVMDVFSLESLKSNNILNIENDFCQLSEIDVRRLEKGMYFFQLIAMKGGQESTVYSTSFYKGM